MGTSSFHLIGYGLVAVMWAVAIFGLIGIGRSLREFLAPHESPLFNAVREDWAMREDWAPQLSFPRPLCHSREGGNPVQSKKTWVPAFAGMTGKRAGMTKKSAEMTADSRIKKHASPKAGRVGQSFGPKVTSGGSSREVRTGPASGCHMGRHLGHQAQMA